MKKETLKSIQGKARERGSLPPVPAPKVFKSKKDYDRKREKKEGPRDGIIMAPSPDVRYQMHLEYLGKLCELIAEKYREKLWE